MNYNSYEIPYWDEGNKNNTPWYRKGWWKTYTRKKMARQRIKDEQADSTQEGNDCSTD